MNNQLVDRQSDETRLIGELDHILTGLWHDGYNRCNVEKNHPDGYDNYTYSIDSEEAIKQILAWHETEINKLYSLIEELTDKDDCYYDHHGYCQAHSLHDSPCPHSRAKMLLNTSK